MIWSDSHSNKMLCGCAVRRLLHGSERQGREQGWIPGLEPRVHYRLCCGTEQGNVRKQPRLPPRLLLEQVGRRGSMTEGGGTGKSELSPETEKLPGEGHMARTARFAT